MVALLFFPLEFVGFAVQVDLPQIAAMDLFVFPTVGFNLLYALVISSCWARRIRKLRQRGRTSDSVVHPLAGQTCPRHPRGD